MSSLPLSLPPSLPPFLSLPSPPIPLGYADHRVYSNMSRAHLALGRPNEALANAEESCSLHPSWPKVREKGRGGRERGRGGKMEYHSKYSKQLGKIPPHLM